MSQVSLSSGLRSSVNSLIDISGSIATENARLSSGKKINSALDNPTTYFLAMSFQTESTNLGNLLDQQNLAISSVSRATTSLASITTLVQSISALVKNAQSLVNTDATNRDNIGNQIKSLYNQIDSVERDATFNGVTILNSASNTPALTATGTNSAAFVASTALKVITNTAATAAAQTTVNVATLNTDINTATAGGVFANTINGTALSTTTGLTYTAVAALGNTIIDGTNGATYAAGAFTGATGDTKLAALAGFVSVALTNLAVAASSTAIAGTVLSIRQSFTTASQRTSQSASDSLTAADLNLEGANLTALQTRQSFAVTSLQLAGQADKAVLRLFG